MQAVLGPIAGLIRPDRGGVKWNPSDEVCPAGELCFASDELCLAGELCFAQPRGQSWQPRGEVLEIEPYDRIGRATDPG